MAVLSAFADEISPDLGEQLAVLKRCGVTHFDLRGVWNTGVMDLTQTQLSEIKRTIDGEGVRVAAIGSPIGKSTIDKPPSFELDRVRKACDIARFFGTTYIRVFSFYAPEGKKIADYGPNVIERMAGWIDQLSSTGPSLVLTHENESAIYGEQPAACLEILARLHGPRFVGCYDPANFTHAGVVDQYENSWMKLKRYVGFFHLKDMKRGGAMVPCGEGDGEIARILRDAHGSGYDGIMTLEPHLSSGGQFAGFTGPRLFETAVSAVRTLCAEIGFPLR